MSTQNNNVKDYGSVNTDEFGESAVQPLPEAKNQDKPWRGCGPSYEGVLTPCFEGGHLYRIVNQEEKKWALYNDTSVYEMHVTFFFGKDSQLEALGNTEIKLNEKEEVVATTVVYPLETVMFITGTWNGYRSRFEGKPLSRAYLEKISNSTLKNVEKAINEVSQLCVSTDPNIVLQACILNHVPFVDPDFPPTHKSLDSNKGIIPPIPWCRPADYLPKELLDYVGLFRMPITPLCLERGDLSDSWVISAMAALAEKEECIKNIFRHPVDHLNTKKEMSIGAYRALINKDGIWNSYLIDAFLPVVGGKPRFARNKMDPCEMWVSLLEKAYAKRNGGYANICSGDPLIALRDFTGWPTSRLDAAFSEAKNNTDKSDGFFTRLLGLSKAGHTILFSTPGTAGEKSNINKYEEAGIVIGYALSVLSVDYINGYGLFRLRNPWSNGKVKWCGNWSPSSHLWEDNPDLAAECSNHDGSDGSLWMDWADIKDYFIGCGVLYNFPSHYDYRVSGTFTKRTPSFCFEISVAAPVILSINLSQPDHRGTEKETVDYDPIMLNVAYSEDSTEQFTVIANTSADAENPTDRYLFLHGRDVSMTYEFLPEHSPYLVIPRRMEYAEGVGELPFTMGVLSPLLITENGPLKVLFKVLPSSNEVFENYPQFTNDGEVVSVKYQVKYPNSYLSTMTECQIK